MKLSKKRLRHLLSGAIVTTAVTTVTSGLIGTCSLIIYFTSENKDSKQLNAVYTFYGTTLASLAILWKLRKLKKEDAASLEDQLPSQAELYAQCGCMDKSRYLW